MSEHGDDNDEELVCFACKGKKGTARLIVNTDSAIFCEKCNWSFHPGCFNTRLRKTSGAPQPNKCCSFFTQSVLKINSTFVKITEMSSTLLELKDTIGDMHGLRVSDELQSLRQEVDDQRNRGIADAVAEMALRKSKELNLIIYNLPDNDKKDEDQDLIKKFLDPIPELSVAGLKITRIGQYVNNKARPTRITVQKVSEAKTMLKNRNLLLEKLSSLLNLSSTDPKLGLTTDKTNLQRDLLKKSIEDLRARKEKGEEDLQIRFFNGNPTIVKNKTRNVISPGKAPQAGNSAQNSTTSG